MTNDEYDAKFDKLRASAKPEDIFWIVYRLWPIPGGGWGKEVEYIVRTEKEAKVKQDYMTKKLDSRFGTAIQEWIID